MAEAEYRHVRSWLDEDDGHDLARAMGVPIEDGRAAAQKRLGESPPSG
jgi:hypothetical protein